ncbi:MAG: nicotinate phosphoribosyltransferase [Thermoleophilia bacterium]
MSPLAGRDGASTALLLDLYELTMAQSYWAEGMTERLATFSLTCRGLPRGWGFLLAAGLDDALALLERLRFTEADLAHLASLGRFRDDFLAWLGTLRFTGDVRALPEGTPCFPDEPLLEVTGPLVEAQLAETALMNVLHVHTLLASKAARSVAAARGRPLAEFGLRRTHGPDAGLAAARAAYLAGFASTSDVLAGARFGIPVSGTMAHSYVESFPDELTAFRAYARAFPDAAILLVDTYDTVAGARNAAIVGRELAAAGHALVGVRLDSGDLGSLAHEVRRVLDEAGLRDTTIVASGGLDERSIAGLIDGGAPIDAFGVGTRVVVSADAPALDIAYKLVALDGRATVKLAPGKVTLPGAKQVWRVELDGVAVRDVLGLADEPGPPGGRPLLEPVLVAGRRTGEGGLAAARARAARERAILPDAVRALDAAPYPVERSGALERLLERAVGEARGHAGPGFAG